jgi:hypothetical protein
MQRYTVHGCIPCRTLATGDARARVGGRARGRTPDPRVEACSALVRGPILSRAIRVYAGLTS